MGDHDRGDGQVWRVQGRGTLEGGVSLRLGPFQAGHSRVVDVIVRDAVGV